MKIINNFIPVSTLEKFADEHNLTMIVKERKTDTESDNRFFAEFENAEIREGIILSSAYGNGNTPERAIKDYARKIELKTIVIDAYGTNREVIDVPRWESNTEESK
jgi:hypothetical protein